MKKQATSCESCAYYSYDEIGDYYSCEMSLDEDEAVKFMRGDYNSCPYYRSGDEYAIVRKQN